ncbi:peptidase M1 [Chryseobacterium sp. Leaf180]|uniref:M1 family metallopeptidase n=1 Tax=Chryseobacterium sp. Leaf180 TaxID=1736289 RepID=UPI0006F29F70|nr:M1 family metallopeptidase [Chryseobacterium sp. Leaf180]KQR94495.1 peptidase M1 [Chryseobacterium sp. Leaf180]
MKKLTYAIILCSGLAFGQFFEKNKTFTKQDSLKGSDTQFRNFWDVKRYDLSVEPDFKSKSISGHNLITFTLTKDVIDPVFQIDLQQPMKADKVECSFPLKGDFKRDGDFIFISAKKSFKKGEKHTIDVTYSGNPVIAKRAPWDGGWVFTKDEKGNPWMSVADEGIGASVWLPTKDIWSDEPDEGITMKISTPQDLVGVGNGRLTEKKTENGKNTFTWEIKNPINAYSIIPNIGKYVNFKDSYMGEKGKLDLDYWVIDYNLDKAKKQFQQVQPMMKAFEYWFGPYPFYEDSYKLVESPYLGMEHQSNVAYGNGYENGYMGQDYSGTGVGLNWDYIIIHESGHEWFANNITAKDQADMWVHEGFTMYSEVLFTEHFMDKKSADIYAQGIQNGIQNDIPIIGKYGVRNEGSGDMYPKGASLLHTIRQVINNDEKFRQILRGLNKDFYHQTVTTQQVEKYISEKAGIDFSTVFDQYLRTVKVPVLEYSQKGNELKFKYSNTVQNLKLPVRIGDQTINPTAEWQTLKLKSSVPVEFNRNYYIMFKKV